MQEDLPVNVDDDFDQASFYLENQAWLMGEVENYISAEKKKKKELEEVKKRNEEAEGKEEEKEQ